MPRIALIVFAVVCAAVGVTACNNGNTNTPTPVLTTTPSPTPDKDIHTAVLQVTVNGTPTVNIPVAMSTPHDSRPGKTIATMRTGADGVVKFEKLNYKASYCWVATLGPGDVAYRCAPPTVWQFTDPLVFGT